MEKTIFICFILFSTLFLFEGRSISPALQQTQAIPEPQQEVQASTRTVSLSELVEKRSASALIDVPIIKQLPELYNGCEVTSLSMLLHAVGHPVSKMELAEKVKKDPTPFKGASIKQITQWGDPNEGFVGDITGKRKGYGVYNAPLYQLLQEYVSNKAVNLTGKDFSTLEWIVDQGHPVVVWTTTGYQPTNQWVTWKKDQRSIKATFQEHVVLMVGYDAKHIYINDPLSGAKGLKISKQNFIESWAQLGSQAISVLDETHLVAWSK